MMMMMRNFDFNERSKERDGMGKSYQSEEERGAGNPGVIGSGSSSILPRQDQTASSHPRGSRFFPTKDNQNIGKDSSRPGSLSPPPPTMEGHPAYEGDVMHPHVSLPKPHPIVKLPPAMIGGHSGPSQPESVWAKARQAREFSLGAQQMPPSAHEAHGRVSELTRLRVELAL